MHILQDLIDLNALAKQDELKKFRPMLADKIDDVNQLSYPLYACPKLDGIRALNSHEKLLSRSLKDIPNRFAQSQFAIPELHGIDGELIVGAPTDKHVYTNTTSGCMSRDGEPDVSYYVFDIWALPNFPFFERLALLERAVGAMPADMAPKVQVVPHRLIETPEELLSYEQECLDQGYEGLIVRSSDGQYKFGRSTLKQGWMLKLKRFEDAEAEIIGVEELYHNDNEKVTNELGLSERGHSQANLRAGGTMGKLVCRDLESGQVFKIGTGFSAKQRSEFWEARDLVPGQFVKYKSFKIGVKDAPRHPVYLGMRDPIDMGDAA